MISEELISGIPLTICGKREKKRINISKKRRILNKKRGTIRTLFSDLQATRKMHSEAKSCKIHFSVGLCLVTI
jgi:hypothetical protein